MPARIVAVALGHRVAPRDLGRAGALVGEGREDQPVDALRRGLRIGAGADRARRGAVHVQLLLSGLLHHHRHRGLQVLDAARDVGIVAGRARAAVAVMIHRPDVEAVARQDVHHRVLALAGNPRGRSCEREEFDEPCTRNSTGCVSPGLAARALAVEVELYVALVGPVLVRLDFGLGALRARLADQARARPAPAPAITARRATEYRT